MLNKTIGIMGLLLLANTAAQAQDQNIYLNMNVYPQQKSMDISNLYAKPPQPQNPLDSINQAQIIQQNALKNELLREQLLQHQLAQQRAKPSSAQLKKDKYGGYFATCNDGENSYRMSLEGICAEHGGVASQ